MKSTERILQYLESKGISKYKFYKETGLSNGFLDKSKSIGTDKCEIINNHYHDLNIEWLVTGKGNMLVNNIDKTKYIEGQQKSIPLIPVEAIAGIGKSDCVVMENDIIDRYIIPEFKEKKADFLIRVSGSSMYPKYSNGDLLACRTITDTSFFQWGKAYVLDSDQGPLVKRIFPCNEDDNYLECRSDNSENYPPFKIAKISVRRVALVIGVIRLE